MRNANSRRLAWSVVFSALVVPVLLGLSLVSYSPTDASAASAADERRLAGAAAEVQTGSLVAAPPYTDRERMLADIAAGPFEPSLEMRENVDFLVTPALLVQESIDKEVVRTYPDE